MLASLVTTMPWQVNEALASARGVNVADTPHNLSVSGKGAEDKGNGSLYQSAKEERICIFCHAPHHANSEGPLWSRGISSVTAYIPYASPTLKAKPGQPREASRLCLSCHDGTVALGALNPSFNLDEGLPNMGNKPEAEPATKTSLGWDLSDDHPISFLYSAEQNGEIADLPTIAAAGIKLSQGAYLECTSCHNPHNNQNDNFTVINNLPQENPGTPLCTTCHRKTGWLDDSSHRTGGTRDSANGPRIAQWGCINCHLPHNAPGAAHLLKSAVPAANCYQPEEVGSCHNGKNNDGNIAALFRKPYTHALFSESGVHVQTETLPARIRHVECADCHDPHQASYQGVPLGSADPAVPPASMAPAINGPLRGARGVDEWGKTEVTPATAEYQVCYKCHAYTNAVFAKYGDRPVRQWDNPDQSARFSTANQSYHPVTGNRRGTGRSLLVQYQFTMTRIYCADCHSPMGADEKHMLRERNSDTFPAMDQTYPLCFRCHDAEYLLNPMRPPNAPSVALHKAHVLDHLGKEAPCSACHDPHGVAANEYLINFDTRYAGLTPSFASRSCSVSCHGSNPRSY
ncbi:cytochrome c3 family protein [Geotalea sp. SG265]|uniref:cytochrome c3 family protein n=1 Tax=Geotalea sp. SG265 TaxID=2922867 RepID=UPI001FAFA52D|nr:cytochrome c3 family protein [Geotalea sp. SG265]